MARPGLTTHRKFRRLARALGSPITARGVLELMWEGCYESGNEYLGTADDLEAAIGWTGEPGMVAEALVACGAPEGHGFIEIVDPESAIATYRVHDLWHHAPDYVRKRHEREIQRQQRVSPSAKRRRTAPNGKQRTPSRDSQTGVDRTPAPAPAPSPAPEEKSVSSAPSPATEPLAAGPPVLSFPVVGSRDQPTWGLTQRQVDEWSALYPGLDVMAEARKALAWVSAKPQQRKTAGGMPKFLVNWFNRTIDRRGTGPPSVSGRTAGNLASLQRFAARGGGAA